jgi:hypothetical protein
MTTGLAIITNGRYPISQSEGEAIASFVPPPCLQNIDWESLKPSHKWLFEDFHKHWQIIAHWLVYLRTGAVDIKQEPFIIPEFLDKRPLAELYSSQLDLCKVLWEVIEIRYLYPTPYHWWKDCMIELQEAQKSSIMASGGIERTTLLKGETEDGFRKFIRSLIKKESIPFKKSRKNHHLFRLCTHSIIHKSKKQEVRKAWNDYLAKHKTYTKMLKTNNDVKMIVHLAGTLYYQGEKNRLVRIQYK